MGEATTFFCSVSFRCGNFRVEMEITDQDLLRKFRDNRCEASFRQLVDRHLKMVFSVAYRVSGERGLAEEIAQSTFAKLADSDAKPDVVAGWLYHTARNLALTTVRSESRRKQREQLAVTMELNEPTPDQLTEHLEPALEQLGPEERDVLVLRFFEERNLRDVGAELGLSEDAARMRVNRALEKLRSVFGKLGITGTTTWLATALPTSASAAVPTSLGSTITTTVLSGGALAAAATTIATETASNTMSAFLNLKTAAAVVAAATIAGTSTYVAKDKQVEELAADYQSLNQANVQLTEQQLNALEMLQQRDRRITSLEKDVGDIHHLRGEVDRLNRGMEELAAVKAENMKLLQENTRLGMALQSASAESDASDERTNQEPERLFTRSFKNVGSDFTENLKLVTGSKDENHTGTKLFLIALRQIGIELEPPEMCYLDEANGHFFVRADLETLERVNWLIRVVQNRNGSSPLEVSSPASTRNYMRQHLVPAATAKPRGSQ